MLNIEKKFASIWDTIKISSRQLWDTTRYCRGGGNKYNKTYSDLLIAFALPIQISALDRQRTIIIGREIDTQSLQKFEVLLKGPAPQTEKPDPIALTASAVAKLLGSISAGRAAGSLALLILLVFRLGLHGAVGHGVLSSG